MEEQLSDGRQYLLDTEQPGLVDIDVHFLHSWFRTFKNLKEVYDPAVFPKTIEVHFVIGFFIFMMLTSCYTATSVAGQNY